MSAEVHELAIPDERPCNCQASGPALRLVEPPAEPALPKCGHLGCGAPGSNVTTLVWVGGERRKMWDLRHCDEHRDDGPQMVRDLGFTFAGGISSVAIAV